MVKVYSMYTTGPCPDSHSGHLGTEQKQKSLHPKNLFCLLTLKRRYGPVQVQTRTAWGEQL